MPNLKTLEMKANDAHREVRNLIVMGMRPDLSAKVRELVPLLERSARAEVKLRIKALQYCREQQRGGQRSNRRAGAAGAGSRAEEQD